MEFSKKYLEIINGEFKGLNLTLITDVEEFHQKQYLDSVMPFRLSEVLNLGDNIHLDIGFGGGFPCLPLLHEFNQLNFFSVGCEARAKKVKAVNHIAKKLGLTKFLGTHLRVENLLVDKECIITFKAVGKISNFLSKINVANKSIKVLFYKGPGLAELEPGFEHVDGWDLLENTTYNIGSNSRSFLVYEPTDLSKDLDKRLVKLSSILSNK